MVFVRRNIAVVHIPRGWLTQYVCISARFIIQSAVLIRLKASKRARWTFLSRLSSPTREWAAAVPIKLSALVCAHTVP